MEVIGLRPYTYKFSERLYGDSNNTGNINNQFIAHPERSFPSHFKSAPVPPLLINPLSIRIMKPSGGVLCCLVSFGFGEADFLIIRHPRYSYLQNLVQIYSMYLTCQAYNNIRQTTKQAIEVKRH